jgi:ankyrin repeat protein
MKPDNKQSLIEMIHQVESRHGAAAALAEAARWGFVEEVARLLDSGVAVNADAGEGRTALMYASDPRIAKLLVGRGADVNARDNIGRTPLIWCLLGVLQRKRAVAYIRALVKFGADTSAVSQRGESVEQLLVDKYGQDMLKLLQVWRSS